MHETIFSFFFQWHEMLLPRFKRITRPTVPIEKELRLVNKTENHYSPSRFGPGRFNPHGMLLEFHLCQRLPLYLRIIFQIFWKYFIHRLLKKINLIMQIWTSTVVELEPFEFKKQEKLTIKIIDFWKILIWTCKFGLLL